MRTTIVVRGTRSYRNPPGHSVAGVILVHESDPPTDQHFTLKSTMRSTIRLLAFALAVSVGITILAGSVTAEPEHVTERMSGDSAAVAGVVDQFHDALTKGDSATALSLLAPDAVVLESGRLETRNEYRSHHLSSDMQFSRVIKAVRGPVKVVVAGDVAWTSGTSTAEGEFNGRAINTTGAESMVLSRSSGVWRIRSIHWSSRNRRPAS